MQKKILLLFLGIFFGYSFLFSQALKIPVVLDWADSPVLMEDGVTESWYFDGAGVSGMNGGLPLASVRFDLPYDADIQVTFSRTQYEPFPMKKSSSDEFLGEQIDLKVISNKHQNNYYGKVIFCPIIKQGNTYKRLLNGTLNVTYTPRPQLDFRDLPTYTSALSDGTIYRMDISETGVYKLSYSFLKDQLNISNIDNIDPRKIQLLGNGGGMLPIDPDDDRIDDLQQNKIVIVGEEDGSFDANDYLLFYGYAANRWQYDEEKRRFNQQMNFYDTKTSYYLKIGATDGIRLSTIASEPSPNTFSSGFNDYFRYEKEEVNVFKEWDRAEGSGTTWFGDYFKVGREKEYNSVFSIPNLKTADSVFVDARMALRSDVQSNFELIVNNQTLNSGNAGRILTLTGSGDNTTDYYKFAYVDEPLFLSSDNIDAKIIYPYPAGASSSEGWLDYIQINARRELVLSGEQLSFRDLKTVGSGNITEYTFSNASNTWVWKLDQQGADASIAANQQGSNLTFSHESTNLNEFVIFNPASTLLQPVPKGTVANQNVHGIASADMVIIYHPDFKAAAERYAQYRQNQNGYEVALVDVFQLYNEFSSGAQDPAAIRNFARMVYDRSDKFKYLLLFGDGSYDYKGIYGEGAHFIPTFEVNSRNPLFSYPTDDFMVILYQSNHASFVREEMHVAVGRFPVKTMEEAERTVDKLISYDENSGSYRDWRNRLAFFGDDEDGNRHIKDANSVADLARSDYKKFNVDKLYIDAFPQESTPAGDLSPQINEAINNNMFKGALVMAYLGHGGPKGWAQERILTNTDIFSWQNPDHYPIFITATCSFAPFDDPAIQSSGENVFLQRNGGAVALFTTTRSVYAHQNRALTTATAKYLLSDDISHTKTMGEVLLKGKNEVIASTGENTRKFMLIGDPSQVVAAAQYEIRTTKINDSPVTDQSQDTLRALETVTIEGDILDSLGNVYTSFNGVIYPTIFDKVASFTTLGQDSGSTPYEYDLQKSVLFKGRASVINGHFQFTCVIPKDINFEFGDGKISYYASDTIQRIDAAGYYDKVIIGGTNPNGFTDDEGPLVDVYMNTEDFVFGGITDPNPTLLVKLKDDFGINVVGNSIGHDLEGLLDGNTQNTYLLNDFYEAEQDDYRQGTVRFPLKDIEPGLHNVKVKAWDVSNNSSEGYTEFVVAESAVVALEHVLNYPNPFFDHTCFQFDHNMTGLEMEVLIRIYTNSGKLVKTIEKSMISEGSIRKDNCIEWDGLDDYGDQLARGVYIYKVFIRATNVSTQTIKGESGFEKLVILK